MNRIERIRTLLETGFSPLHLQVSDDSDQHAGHEGARDGRGHFSVEIVSEAFTDQPSLARHRAVYAALGDMMVTDIHALTMKVMAPGEPGADKQCPAGARNDATQQERFSHLTDK